MKSEKKDSINIYKIDEITKKKIKENMISVFRKFFLFSTTTIAILSFILILIFCITPFSNGEVKSGLETITDINGVEFIVEYKPDANLMYVFNANNSNIILLINVIGLSGWITLLIYLSIVKNFISSTSIKKTIRKTLYYGYLKQKQVERVIDEIDINIGIKKEEENEEIKEMI